MSGEYPSRPRIIVQGGGFGNVLHDKKTEYLKGIKESVTAGYEILKVSFAKYVLFVCLPYRMGQLRHQIG